MAVLFSLLLFWMKSVDVVEKVIVSLWLMIKMNIRKMGIYEKFGKIPHKVNNVIVHLTK